MLGSKLADRGDVDRALTIFIRKYIAASPDEDEPNSRQDCRARDTGGSILLRRLLSK
jgi:hypothetical protein